MGAKAFTEPVEHKPLTPAQIRQKRISTINTYTKILRDFCVSQSNRAEFKTTALEMLDSGRSQTAIDNLFRKYRDSKL